LNVSEQQAEQTHAEGGSVGTEQALQTSPPEAIAPVTASALETSAVVAPAIAPDHEAPPKEDAPKIQNKVESSIESKSEAPKEASKEASKIDAGGKDAVAIGLTEADAAKMNASFMSGRLLLKSPGKRGWHGAGASAKAESEPRPSVSTQRRQSGMAAVVALAALAGAISGTLATVAVIHFAAADAASTNSTAAVEASVSRIDADIVALKAGLDHATKTGQSQLNKTNDRLDKVEKAQAEPASKLAKLGEAMDRLRIPPAAAPATAAAATPAATTRDITGSVTPPASANAAAVASSATTASAPPKTTDVARLPTLEGWTLRDVRHGGALIEGRQGLYEVYAGDPVPGLGKVDAIRKQDGRWVVVTTKGLVVAR
jgi:hypothetical protein